MPFYFGLLVALVILLVKFAQEAFGTLSRVFSLSTKAVIVEILSLTELTLIASLLLIVIFAGYQGLVSRLEEQTEESLDWVARVGYGGLKLKLMASIAAISGVYFLERVIGAERSGDRDLAWVGGAFALFVVAAVLLAAMERLYERRK